MPSRSATFWSQGRSPSSDDGTRYRRQRDLTQVLRTWVGVWLRASCHPCTRSPSAPPMGIAPSNLRADGALWRDTLQADTWSATHTPRNLRPRSPGPYFLQWGAGG